MMEYYDKFQLHIGNNMISSACNLVLSSMGKVFKENKIEQVYRASAINSL